MDCPYLSVHWRIGWSFQHHGSACSFQILRPKPRNCTRALAGRSISRIGESLHSFHVLSHLSCSCQLVIKLLGSNRSVTAQQLSCELARHLTSFPLDSGNRGRAFYADREHRTDQLRAAENVSDTRWGYPGEAPVT